MEDVVKSFLFVFATFLPIIDPFVGAMFFLSLTPGASDEIRAKITERMAIYSLIVLLVSLFAGRVILSFFGISVPVLQVGGGLVLLSSGWEALHAPTLAEAKNNASQVRKSDEALLSMAFYPLTLPLVIGPGTIASAAAIGSSLSGSIGSIVGSVLASVAMTVLTWFCFRYSDKIPKALGAAGADALSRLFAFILMCLGVGVLWQGISGLIMSLPK